LPETLPVAAGGLLNWIKRAEDPPAAPVLPDPAAEAAKRLNVLRSQHAEFQQRQDDKAIWQRLSQLALLGGGVGLAGGGAYALFNYLRRPSNVMEYLQNSPVGGRLRPMAPDETLEIAPKKKREKRAGEKDIYDVLSEMTSQYFPTSKVTATRAATGIVKPTTGIVKPTTGIVKPTVGGLARLPETLDALGDRPWMIPAGALAVGGGLYGAYQLAAAMSLARKRSLGEKQKEEAKKRFQEAISEQFHTRQAAAAPDLSALDSLYDRWVKSGDTYEDASQALNQTGTLVQETLAAPFHAAATATSLGRNALPLWLAYAATSAPLMAALAYSRNRAADTTEKSLKATLKRRAAIEALKAPPELHFRVRSSKKKPEEE